MTVTQLEHSTSHAKHGHFRSASQEYELHGKSSHSNAAELNFLVAWAVTMRDYYGQESPSFIQIRPKPECCAKPSGETVLDTLHFQEWTMQIEAESSGRDLMSYVSRSLDSKTCCSYLEAKGQTAVFIINHANFREQPNERSQILKQLQV